MEWSGKIVGEGTAVVFLGHWYQAGEPDEEQQEQLKGKGRSEHSVQETSAWLSWLRLRKGGIGATFYGPERRINRKNSNISNVGWMLILAPSPSWKLQDHAKYNLTWPFCSVSRLSPHLSMKRFLEIVLMKSQHLVSQWKVTNWVQIPPLNLVKHFPSMKIIALYTFYQHKLSWSRIIKMWMFDAVYFWVKTTRSTGSQN